MTRWAIISINGGPASKQPASMSSIAACMYRAGATAYTVYVISGTATPGNKVELNLSV